MMRVVAAIAILLTTGSTLEGQTVPTTTPPACAALMKLQVPGVALTVSKAEWFPAGAAPAAGPAAASSPVRLPAYCRLDGVIDRRTGFANVSYGIGFALALPENWNGRFLF